MSKLNPLLESSSEDEADDEKAQALANKGLTINTNYAASYKRFREKEVFQRLKAKYGEDAAKERLDEAEASSDSDASSEDEEAKEWTEEMDKDFLKTMAYLKGNDPKIYDKGQTFFHEKKDSSKIEKKVKEKPMHLADFEREVMVNRQGHFDEVEDVELARKSQSRTYVEEQEEIRQSFKKALLHDV